MWILLGIKLMVLVLWVVLNNMSLKAQLWSMACDGHMTFPHVCCWFFSELWCFELSKALICVRWSWQGRLSPRGKREQELIFRKLQPPSWQGQITLSGSAHRSLISRYGDWFAAFSSQLINSLFAPADKQEAIHCSTSRSALKADGWGAVEEPSTDTSVCVCVCGLRASNPM